MSNENLEESQLNLVKLQERNRFLEQQIKELSATNDHLVTATWRERKLKEELRDHKNVIEAQSRKISESINYAKKIQKALTVTSNDIRNCFPESFMMYFPKDVVSGDYPWFYRKDDYAYIAAVDCTGHGVPGAMLAVVSCLLLNDIINDPGTPSPNEVLTKLNAAMANSLRQHDKRSPKDGLDIALARVHMHTLEVEFCGAGRPFLYTKGNKLEEIKGDFMSIGGDQRLHQQKSFSGHTVQLKNGDSFFLFSDGLQDQFCAAEQNKFSLRRIKNMISSHYSHDFARLQTKISEAYLKWKGNSPQTDDILLLGIKI